MKQIYFLLLLAGLFSFVNTSAQNTSCAANFSFANQANGQVQFTSTSNGTNGTTVSNFFWRFGDGATSNVANPSHLFTSNGTYTVFLNIVSETAGIRCTDSTMRQVTIQNATCNLVTSFTSLQTNPSTYSFTNTSSGASSSDSIRWTFGDGTSANTFNAAHTYAQPGTYNVCLRIIKRNSNSTPSDCTRDICHTITINATSTCNLQASFTASHDSIGANTNTYHFTNTSAGAATTDSIRWTFGDGTSANTYNAVHTYTQPGTYNVCLRIIKRNPNGELTSCISDVCHSVSIAVNCTTQEFNVLPVSNTSTGFQFVTAINTTWQYSWSFGDGTTSSAPNPAHTYTHGGSYQVCLTVVKSASCSRTFCRVITVAPLNLCDSATLSYTYRRDSLNRNKYYFSAVSNFPTLNQTWRITKLSGNVSSPPVVIQQNNPQYIFVDSGYYRVCLNASFGTNCNKESCRVIHVETAYVATSACSLIAYPNPATNVINSNVILSTPQTITMKIFSTNNVLLRTKIVAGVIGFNVVSMNIGDLLPGVYLIKIKHGDSVCSGQFVKI